MILGVSRQTKVANTYFRASTATHHLVAGTPDGGFLGRPEQSSFAYIFHGWFDPQPGACFAIVLDKSAAGPSAAAKLLCKRQWIAKRPCTPFSTCVSKQLWCSFRSLRPTSHSLSAKELFCGIVPLKYLICPPMSTNCPIICTRQ
jgi:hypothetical protein